MRETLLYGLAFLVILGTGAFLILPRLQAGRDGGPAPRGAPGDPAPADEPSDADPEPQERGTAMAGPAPAFAASLVSADLTALAGPVELSITGLGGALRGPLKPVVGATFDAPGEGVSTVTPTAARVAFGAVGHQWVELSGAALRDGMTIELPPAAPAIVVRVVEADGRPAADVPVRVRPASPLGTRRTDSGGTLVLDDLPPGNVFVDATSRERTGPMLRLRTGVDREVALRLDPVWTVTGLVRAPGGSPVAGARVEAFAAIGPIGSAVSTDADGRFRWTGPVAGTASFRIRDPAYAEIAAEAMPPAVGALASDLGTLRFEGPGASVAVTVRCSIPGDAAVVEVEPAVADIVRELFGSAQALDRPRTERIADGKTVRLEGLPAGIPLRVSVRGAGVPVDAVVMLEPAEERTLTFLPEAGGVLGGVIADAAGRPQAGVRVLVSATPREGDLKLQDEQEVYTGVGGGFEVYGLASRVAYLRAYVPGHRRLLQRVDLPLTEPVRLTLESTAADAAQQLQGRVRDDEGTPLEGVTIQAAGVRTQTDAEGRFRLEGVVTRAPLVRVAYGYEPGPLSAAAPHPKAFGRRAFTDATRGSGKLLDLVLGRTVDVDLTLADAIDDQPIGLAHVIVRGPRGGILFDRVLASREGAITLPALSAFDHASAHAPDAKLRIPIRRGALTYFVCTSERRAQGKVRVEAGARADAGRVLLKRGMRIRGTVKTAAGRALAGARVAGMDAGWQSRGTDPEREREVLYRTTQTDADGRFELRGFNPKRGANIVAWIEDHTPVVANVLLPPFSDDIDAEVEIRLGTGANLLLILEDAGSKRPIEGAMMDIEYAVDGEDYLDLIYFGALAGPVGSTREWNAASQLLLFATQERGHYRLGPLRPGPYELWIEHPGYQAQRTRLTLPGRGQTFYDAVSFRHNAPGKRFDLGTISFKGNTLRLIIPLEGR